MLNTIAVRRLIAGIALTLAPTLSTAQDNTVHLLIKGKVTGTTYTSVVLLKSDHVRTIEDCEKERRRGFHDRWRYYGHIVKRVQGVAFQVNYFCVQSAKSYSEWQDSAPYKHIYLVEINEDGLNMATKESYASCLRTLRKTQKEESEERFCATANQISQ